MEAESDVCDIDDDPQEQVEDFITVTEDDAPRESDDGNPVIWMPEESMADHGDIQAGDDSEILVIEDELELRRVDAAARVDSQDQMISVDFQAMLNRMRSGS
mgnify:CR=1 FL=1